MLLVFIWRFNDAKFHSVTILGPPSVERLSFELVLPFFLCLGVHSHANRWVTFENATIYLLDLFVVILGYFLNISYIEVFVDRCDVVRVN